MTLSATTETSGQWAVVIGNKPVSGRLRGLRADGMPGGWSFPMAVLWKWSFLWLWSLVPYLESVGGLLTAVVCSALFFLLGLKENHNLASWLCCWPQSQELFATVMGGRGQGPKVQLHSQVVLDHQPCACPLHRSYCRQPYGVTATAAHGYRGVQDTLVWARLGRSYRVYLSCRVVRVGLLCPSCNLSSSCTSSSE